MKVLIVEDQIETVKDIVAHCEDNAWEVETISFDDFEAQLEKFMPDVVVLDWKDDAANAVKGDQVFEQIWTNGFRPIIVFSAIANTIELDDKYRTSNLIQLQPKGDEQPVIDYLDKICAFAPVISNIKDEFNDALIQALNSIEMMSKAAPLSENVMRYVFAKRVSTYFDEECGDDAPPAWVQYTYPAITKTLCVSDVIRSIPADIASLDNPGQPEEYSIILTPSCDMAQSNVTHALCAKCYSKNNYHGFTINGEPSPNQIKRVVSYLNTGYNNSLVSLPSIPHVTPYLTVDLKKVDLYPIEQIALQKEEISGHHKYCRIASIDSPFREQIVWAHMINACRPGMPNRDMNLWAKELMLP